MYNHNNQTSQISSLMRWQSVLRLTAISSMALLSACVSTTPYLDATFGEATREALRQQIINPQAGNKTDPVAGIDGRAARDAMDNYHKSFATPGKSRDLGIGDGAASGGGQ